jgi:hypothetical protein
MGMRALPAGWVFEFVVYKSAPFVAFCWRVFVAGLRPVAHALDVNSAVWHASILAPVLVQVSFYRQVPPALFAFDNL